MQSDALLTVRELDASYGATRVLRGVSLQVTQGGVTGVLGANGAGKTTLLRAICGLMPRRGEIWFAGERIDQLDTADVARRGIAHVPDGRGTFADLSVDDNLRLGAYTRTDKAEIKQDIERMIAYFPRLGERRGQQAGTLSGGEQQMLAIARALMMRPRLLVLDEPSFGLAPLVTQEIFRLMRRLNREEGLSILLVEQNAQLALEFADRACVLETGCVVVEGSPDVLQRDDALRRAYLGS
jgi:branched-chain amino acid transport system ATP-binding protein